MKLHDYQEYAVKFILKENLITSREKNIISVVDNVLQISAIRKRTLTDTTNLRILHL